MSNFVDDPSLTHFILGLPSKPKIKALNDLKVLAFSNNSFEYRLSMTGLNHDLSLAIELAARELYTHFSGLQFIGYGAFTSLLYIAGVDAMPESTLIFTVILLAVWSPAFRKVLQIQSS